MHLLRQILFHNFALKLLAVAISFLLWANYTAQPIVQVGYDVPIAFLNVPRGFTVPSSVPSAAHLLIQGRSALIRGLTPADLAFTVDLASALRGEGSIHLTPEMAVVPYGANILRITPQEIRVSPVASSSPAPPAVP